jgi:hypothetical protein
VLPLVGAHKLANGMKIAYLVECSLFLHNC